jgi:hypothetical protein
MISESIRYFILLITLCLASSGTLIQAIQNIEQLRGKILDPQPFQLIISEIMADPTPQVMLPAIEYIEIFNRGATAIDITGWKLIIGSYEKTISHGVIEPGEYWIICEPEAESLFAVYGKTLPLVNMPPILNSGQVITLKTPSGIIMHTVLFSDRWYNSSEKASGGWSLEIIDPDNPCGGAENWAVSSDSRGGSPGIKNAVDAHNPDNRSPSLLRATLPYDSAVLLHFSEPMDFSSVLSCGQYAVSKGLLHPTAVYPVEPECKFAVLKYPVPFNPDCRYTITLLNSLKDCVGNSLAGNTMADFAISKSPEMFDVVINELLFNAADSMSEFIELYNRSEKVLDLSAFSIAIANNRTGVIKKLVFFNNNPFILFPGSYVVLTTNTKKILLKNPLTSPSVVIEQPELFSLPNEEGLVVLLDTTLQTIDEFHYYSNMHTELLSDSKGVSLERINPDNPSSDPENWQSASTTSGYATPGYQNSQIKLTGDPFEVTLVPEVISPDNDGLDDYVTLHLKLDGPGWVGTITVFDANGRKVKDLISNGLLGTDEYFIWDGKWADEQLATIGIYLIYGEVFSPSGKIKKFNKVITLVRRL